MTASWDGPRRPCLVETAGPGFYSVLITLLIIGGLLAGAVL